MGDILVIEQNKNFVQFRGGENLSPDVKASLKGLFQPFSPVYLDLGITGGYSGGFYRFLRFIVFRLDW